MNDATHTDSGRRTLRDRIAAFWRWLDMWAEALDTTPYDLVRHQIVDLEARVEQLERSAADNRATSDK